MTNHRTATAKAPGKLFLAGEYAVVTSQQTAILITVDAFLTVTCSESNDEMGVFTTNQAKHPFQWIRGENQVFSTTPNAESFNLIWITLDTVLRYYEGCGMPLETIHQYCNINIDSELDHPSGEKFGLGSSAAVTVALIDALLQFFNYDTVSGKERRLLIYKLAVIAQAKLGLSGSFGDIAATSFTGMIFYQNFERSWFNKQPKQTAEDIKLLIDTHWPHLIIRPLNVNTDWTLSVVWSKTASSTEQMLTALPTMDDRQKNLFLLQSKQQVAMIKEAAELNQFQLFSQGIWGNFTTIKKYTRDLQRPYLTDSFEKAEQLATSQKQTFKVSGAGAGDCAYAISPNQTSAHELQATWRANGLTVLPLNIWSAGHFKEE